MSGIYVHVPFCRRRCSYCDFYFVTGSRQFGSFVDALRSEISATPPSVSGETAHTVYFGGGTPSRLAPARLREIADAIHSQFDVGPNAEWTIEINPEDAAGSFLSEIREIGFNRLSIGIQSLQNSDLEFMRRAHTEEDVYRVVDLATASGFQTFSIDLIFGVPGQTSTDWLRSLQFAIDAGVPHVSTYGLTVEPKTVLNKWIRDGLVDPPDEGVLAAHYRQTMSVLQEAGYEHYEISSFCRPGAQSKHNGAYWDHTNYVGFGPSAHSFWWGKEARRWSNPRSLRKYLVAPTGGREQETLGWPDLAGERIMLGLRTSGGISYAELERRYTARFTEAGRIALEELAEAELIDLTDHRFKLTDAGKVVCDSVTSRIIDDRNIEVG